MVTLQRNKESEFDLDPEFEDVRNVLTSLESCVATSPESNVGYQGGSYLSNKLFTSLNSNTIEVTPCDPFDDGNNLLPTIFNFTSLYLLMYVDVHHIGVFEGRGRVEVKPIKHGLSIESQEFDLVKKMCKGEAHGLRRIIYREYLIPGAFDWSKMMHSISPDETLTIKIPTINHFRNFC